MNLPYGAPYTIDQAYPFVRGFPHGKNCHHPRR
jgi:hypothetical protein